MRTIWVMLCIPMQVKPEEDVPLGQTALDTAWERIIDPEGPPEGLIECVVDKLPNVYEAPLVLQGATLDEKGQLVPIQAVLEHDPWNREELEERLARAKADLTGDNAAEIAELEGMLRELKAA